MIIDTHAHLTSKEFKDDLDQIINEAEQVFNVEKIISCATTYNDALNVVKIASTYSMVYSALGYYPEQLELKNLKNDINRLNALLCDENVKKKIVAIGEIGLDLGLYNQIELYIQQEYFTEQIELAIKHDLPIIIHCRDAYKPLIKILNNYKGKIKGVVHCFSGTLEDAKILTDELGLYLGCGGILTYKKNEELRQIIKQVGMKYLIVETDAPYLAPQKMRGKMNKPGFVYFNLENLASIFEVEFNEVEQIVYNNTRDLFKKIIR